MRVVLALSLILLMLGGVAAQSIVAVPTDEVLDAEEYAVYSALIPALIEQEPSHGSIELVVINDHTTKIAEPHYLSGISTRETYDNFKAKNRQSYRLKSLFDLKVKYVLVDEKESRERDWRVLARKYPRSLGSLLFSRVGLNGNKTEALVYEERLCGFACGHAKGYQLIKGKEGWKIKGIRHLWVE